MNRNVLCLFVALAAAGCSTSAVVCREGTDRCGVGCADYQSDRTNCGACGVACQSSQVCSAGACVCQPGSTACGATCAVLSSDPKNCGACGTSCAAGQVCEGGQCKVACVAGTSQVCGGSCVDVTSDVNHCGACGVTCQTGERCKNRRCGFDVIAACFSTGQVVGLQPGSGFKGPLQALGTGPASLASYGHALLAVDGLDSTLHQARLFGPQTLERFPQKNTVGMVANHVFVDAPYVYVVNSASGTLQVFGTDGGVEDGGWALTSIGSLNFGANTFPEAVAKVQGRLWVPLYGGYDALSADAGQRVVEVDVTNPSAPVAMGSVSLKGLDLKAFDGGAPVARPFAIVAHQGALYVALNNLNADTYEPQGPGMVAHIDPVTKVVTLIDLGGARCLNASWIAPVGDSLAVSCSGKVLYGGPPNYDTLGVDRGGLALISGTSVTSFVGIACPSSSDAGCKPVQPGRVAALGYNVYVADQTGGRVFEFEVRDGGLVGRRAYGGEVSGPMQACTPNATTGLANVSDVLAVP